MDGLPVFLGVLLGLLCLVTIYSDLRYMRIPDWISIAAVGVFGMWVLIDYGNVPIVARLIAAAIIFVICFGLFAARIMGGGDTKVIPALSLFVPFAALSSVMVIFAVCLLISIAAVLGLRRFGASRGTTWAVFHSRKLPMGLAIGATGLICLGVTVT